MTSYNSTIIEEDNLPQTIIPSYAETLEITIDYLKEQLEIKDSKIKQLKNKCCICLSSESEYIFTFCGHYCLCHECNTIYSNEMCPKCRTISKCIKVFKK